MFTVCETSTPFTHSKVQQVPKQNSLSYSCCCRDYCLTLMLLFNLMLNYRTLLHLILNFLTLSHLMLNYHTLYAPYVELLHSSTYQFRNIKYFYAYIEPIAFYNAENWVTLTDNQVENSRAKTMLKGIGRSRADILQCIFFD